MERFFDNLNTPKVVVIVALFFVVVNGFLLHRYQQQFNATSDYQAIESPDSDGSPTPPNILSVRPSGATGSPASLAISAFKPTRSAPAETGAQEEAGGGGTGSLDSAGTGVLGAQDALGALETEVTPPPALAPTVADGRWAAAEIVGWAYEVTWGWTTGIVYTVWQWLAPDYQDDGATVSGAAYPADDTATTSSAAYPADDSAAAVPGVAPPAEEVPESPTGATTAQEDTVGSSGEPSTPSSGQAKQQPGGEQTQQQLCEEQPKQQAGGQKKQQSCKEQPKQQQQQQNDKQQQDAGKQQQDLEQQQNDKQQPK